MAAPAPAWTIAAAGTGVRARCGWWRSARALVLGASLAANLAGADPDPAAGPPAAAAGDAAGRRDEARAAADRDPQQFDPQAGDPAASGGDTSVDDVSRSSFTLPAANISDLHRRHFMIGQAVFNQNWVAAPSNNRDRAGLGPLFNAASCSACHAKAGRGQPPDADHPQLLGLLLRLSVPGRDAQGGPRPEPRYGDQFHPYAIMGVPPDGRLMITYRSLPGRFADGTPYELRAPTYRCTDLHYGSMDAATLYSPRVAPALVGLGLLAAVDDATLLALADQEARAGDSVHGRVNHVWDVRRQRLAIGRFGWKANQPSIEQQVAAALHGDMGLTSDLFPQENTTPAHTAALAKPSGGGPGQAEVSALKLHRLTEWVHLLGVPRRRDVDQPLVRQGAALFAQLRCDGCHASSLRTGDLAGMPECSHQCIHPYSDLLLHDLGPGLADGRPDGEAGGRDWRTAPLWGIGLVPIVNGHSYFLHDGRARSLGEAILWHDGEGRASRDRYLACSAAQRQALLAFLASL